MMEKKLEKDNVMIRTYCREDLPQVRRICLETGDKGMPRQKAVQDMLLTAFCNYYVEREPDNCFVAWDGKQVIGYILCAQDSGQWADVFRREYIPADMGEENPLGSFYRGTMESPLKYAEAYPAHLHIDILPPCQRMGVGSRLMHALTAHLQEKGVKGLMLSVATDNEKGRRFYEKYGFEILEEKPAETVMGLLLAGESCTGKEE